MINASQKLMNNVPSKSVYQQGETPNMLGEAYRPIGKTNFQFKDFLNDENKVEEVKSNFTFNHNYLLIFLFFKLYFTKTILKETLKPKYCFALKR